jgi:membrane protease subunit HflK
MAEHEKSCSCSHSHGDEGVDELMTGDVASKSLSDALRVSFTILKIIMAVLVVLFVASGIFKVQYDEQALVLHFGEIRGDESGARVLKSGLHWAWPSPIDEIIKIPVTKKQVLDVDSSWYFVSEAEKLAGKERPPSGDIDPLKDGYCLTRNDSTQGEGTDYSIVHSKWKLTYTIEDVELFFRNIYYNAPKPGEEFLDVMGDTVNPLLTALADDAVVSTLVNFTIDEAIEYSGKISVDVAAKMQAKLDRISSGITVESLKPQKIIWPRQVNAVFEASNMASQESITLVNAAKAYADQKMNQAGGVNADHVFAKLTNDSAMPQDPQEREKLFSLLAGDSQGKIAQARAYRTEVVESAKANAEYLEHLLEGYRKNPKFVLQNIYQQMITEVMSNAKEKIFADTPGEKRIMINSDPSIRKQMKKKDIEEK